jgi:hypothetical protein
MSSGRKRRAAKIARRDLLHVLAAGAGAAVTDVLPPTGAAVAETAPPAKKARARYDASSREVQTFYRVNRYPPR